MLQVLLRGRQTTQLLDELKFKGFLLFAIATTVYAFHDSASIMTHCATCCITQNVNKNCTFRLLQTQLGPEPMGNSAANFRNQETAPAKSLMRFNYQHN